MQHLLNLLLSWGHRINWTILLVKEAHQLIVVVHYVESHVWILKKLNIEVREETMNALNENESHFLKYRIAHEKGDVCNKDLVKLLLIDPNNMFVGTANLIFTKKAL